MPKQGNAEDRLVFLRASTANAADEIDAALFSGDEFIGGDEDRTGARIALRSLCERWLRGLDEQELIDNRAIKDYTVALLEDGKAAWCQTSGSSVDAMVSSEQALIRFEIKLDVESLRVERDKHNEMQRRAQTGDLIAGDQS